MSEDELNWNHQDFDQSDADCSENDYGEYVSDDLYEDDIFDPEDDVVDFEDDDLDPEDDFLDHEFDEERHLFEYDPTTNQIHDDPNYTGGPPSYQKVFTKTEMLSKLLGAWQKRSKGNLQGEFSDAEYSDLFDVNLYQLEEEDRVKLRSFSVRKFLEVIGGQEEVEKFREKIEQILIFTNKVLNSILARCLPLDLPYPALRNILSHLIREEGLHKVGYMSTDDEVEKQLNERVHLHSLENCIMYFYLNMQKLMFNSSSYTVPNSTGFMRYNIKRFGNHFNELKVLAEKMDSGEKVG